MPEQFPTLRDMIKEAVERGLTYAQLGERAVDPETGKVGASGPFINNIALGNVARIPTVDRLRSIATALGVPYERVRQAAINEWMPAPAAKGDPERDEMIRELRELRAKTEKVLARLGDQEPESESA